MSVTSLSTRFPGLGLSSAFSDIFEPWNEWFQNGKTGSSLTLPSVNVSENKDNFNLELAAPGLEKGDFQIDVNGNILTISAKKEDKKEEKNEKYTRKEYNYSSFSRSFTLPEEVQQDKIDASYQNGVLKLQLPKDGKLSKKNHKTIAIK
jgi:HSP20 family protein